jgi:adenosylcobinamide-phosphate synthase
MKPVTDTLLILTCSFLFDYVGEPPETIHPTVLIGRLERFVESSFGKLENTKTNGVLLWLIVIVTTGSLTACLLFVTDEFNMAVYLLASVFLLKSSFALFTMDKHVRPALKALEREDIDGARLLIQRIVRRDTSYLNPELLCSAAIESAAEGLVDGVCSPLFFYALFGVTGAMVYRAINTMDSMVGYKTAQYKHLGWFSAKADTAANFLVSRLVAFLTVASAAVLRMNWRQSYQSILSSHCTTESVNAGYPLSAFSGALDVTLEKKGHYRIEGGSSPDAQAVKRALTLMKVNTVLFTILFVLPLAYLRIQVWWTP